MIQNKYTISMQLCQANAKNRNKILFRGNRLNDYLIFENKVLIFEEVQSLSLLFETLAHLRQIKSGVKFDKNKSHFCNLISNLHDI